MAQAAQVKGGNAQKGIGGKGLAAPQQYNVRRTKSKGLLSDFFGKLMRDDLLHAQASVDWAISNIPIFEERLNSFIKSNLNIIIEDSYSDAFYDPVVVIEKRRCLSRST